MQKSRIPYLSSFNGPSYLLHAVEVLQAIGMPPCKVRLVPVPGHFASPEVLPYDPPEEGSHLPDWSVRLGINVREDNRLGRFWPLVRVGLPPRSALLEWDQDQEPLAEWVRGWCARQCELEPQQDPGSTSGNRTKEDPVGGLIRQLSEQFPELREPESPAESSPERRGIDRQELTPEQRTAGLRITRELVDLFFTQAFLAIAASDWLGGFEFDPRVEPEGRPIPVHIGPHSGIGDVVRWVQAYPHRAWPEVSYEGMGSSEREAWEKYFQAHPEEENFFETARTLWTEEDPAIQAIFQEIQSQYAAGRQDEMSPDEMLTLARKYLPDFLPYYPRQVAVTGGLNWGGLLLRFMRRWLETGPFLGLTWEALERFAPEQQIVLWGLLLYRRQTVDPIALFQTAVVLLVHPAIKVQIEPFQPVPVRLGAPLAQLGKTLVLNGASLLHCPEVQVYIPLDRTRDGEAEEVEAKLELLRCLFLPVHLPVRYRWAVNWALLGQSAYLEGSRSPLSPTKEPLLQSRLGGW